MSIHSILTKAVAIGLSLLCANFSYAGTWALVKDNQNFSCGSGSTTCAVTVQSTGSGNLLVAAVTNGTGTTGRFSTASAGGSWVHPASCASTDASAGWTDFGYVLSSASGVTSITITITAAPAGLWGVDILEYSISGGSTVAFDNCGVRDQSSSVANFAGVSCGTLSGTNDVIIQASNCTAAISGCPNSSASPAVFPNGDGVCGLISSVTTTAGNYTNTAGFGTPASIAFKEVAAASTINNQSVFGTGLITGGAF